jgi:flagellar motility protein MotE (MotC chaperone)
MIRLARDFRLIPLVLLAMTSLFALKVSGLVFDGGYTLAERLQGRDKAGLTVITADNVPDHPKIVVADAQSSGPAKDGRSWAEQMFNYDGGRDITGSIDKKEEKSDGPKLKVSEKPPDPPKLQAGDTTVTLRPGHMASAGERAVLGRLQERREELDQRSRDLDMRESLLKAAEKRLEAKLEELKGVEARIKAAMGLRDKKEEERFKGIVAMYANMKAKDAARIFDRLDMKILVDVSTAMNPRKMSEILAQMAPDAAERLTVELAQRASAPKSPDELPKIEAKPGGA